ncbi:MAG: K+/H+ antiporter subunit F [Gammaproteobacteria bacterium]|nr:K+/H+ antiporter subunit F [Gammaproteobacteria bacterium]
MLNAALNITLVMLTLAMVLAFYRLARGPGVPDRILALDTLYINALALLVVIGIRFGSVLYFEAALLIGMLGFVGTVALATFILRGDIID